MTADVAGAELSVTPRSADWVDVGGAIPLRTRQAGVRITERSDGGFDFEVWPHSDANVFLGEPEVATLGVSGGFVIRVPAHVPAGVR